MLQKTQSEAHSVRTELDKVANLKENLANENEQARDTIMTLKTQVKLISIV